MRFPARSKSLLLRVGLILHLAAAAFSSATATGAEGDLVFAVPSDSDLSVSSHDAELLAGVIASETGLGVQVRTMVSSEQVAQTLGQGTADIGIVANTVVRGRLGALQPIANYTRGKNHPYRLQIVVASSGGATSLAELSSAKPAIALDLDRPDRRWFLLEILGSSETPGGGRVMAPRSSLEALKGVASGRFDAACVENNLLDTFARFSRGEFNQLKVLSSSTPRASDLIAARKGLDPGVVASVQQALLGLENDAKGQQILISLHISRFVTPETRAGLYPTRPATRLQPTASPTATPEPSPTPESSPEEPAPTEAPTTVPEPTTATPMAAGQDSAPATNEGSPTPEPTAAIPPDAGEAADDGGMSTGLLVGLVTALAAIAVVAFLVFGRKKNPPEIHVEEVAESPRHREVYEPDTDPGLTAIHSDAESVLVGDLNSFGVPDLLQLIASAGHTGTLEIESDGGERAVHFSKGFVCGAACLRPDSKNNFCAVMHRMGILSLEEVETTQKFCSQHPGIALREALEELGLARPEQITAAAQRQAEEIIYTILLSPEGRFRFHRDDEPSCVEGIRLAVTDLIFEGARRIDEWQNIRMVVPEDTLVPKVTVGYRVNPEGFELDAEQRHILAFVDGTRTVEAVGLAASRFDFHSTGVLAQLAQKEVIEFPG